MKLNHTQGIIYLLTASLFAGTLLWALLAQSQSDYEDSNIRVFIESPVELSTNANIGSIRGWAVHPYAQMLYVDIYVDGEFSFSVPVGGNRKDVEDA